MDEGDVVVLDDRRAWTPLRVLLLALGAVAGGIALSIALGGPARADAPADPSAPAATSTDTALVGGVTGALTHVTGTAIAPVDALVAQVTRGPVADALPRPTPAGIASATVPVAVVNDVASSVDRLLDGSPVAGTPVWRGLIGAHPLQTVLEPVGPVLRSFAPALDGVLALPGSGTAGSTTLAGLGFAGAADSAVPTPVAAGGARVAAPEVAAPESGAPRAPSAPVAPAPGSPDIALTGAAAPISTPALLAGSFFALLLAVAVLRRPGWRLPSSPVFATDASPD